MNKVLANALFCGLFAVVACSFGSCGSKCDHGVCPKEVPAAEAPAEATKEIAMIEEAQVTETVAVAETAPATTEVAA